MVACTYVSQAAAEEEIKALLAKAKVKGIENQKRMAEEEAVKAAKRAERLELYKANNPDEDDDKKGGGLVVEKKGHFPCTKRVLFLVVCFVFIFVFQLTFSRIW